MVCALIYFSFTKFRICRFLYRALDALGGIPLPFIYFFYIFNMVSLDLPIAEQYREALNAINPYVPDLTDFVEIPADQIGNPVACENFILVRSTIQLIFADPIVRHSTPARDLSLL